MPREIQTNTALYGTGPRFLSFQELGAYAPSQSRWWRFGGSGSVTRTRARTRAECLISLRIGPVRACAYACDSVDGISWIFHALRGQTDVFIMIKLVVSGADECEMSIARFGPLALAENPTPNRGFQVNAVCAIETCVVKMMRG